MPSQGHRPKFMWGAVPPPPLPLPPTIPDIVRPPKVRIHSTGACVCVCVCVLRELKG